MNRGIIVTNKNSGQGNFGGLSYYSAKHPAAKALSLPDKNVDLSSLIRQSQNKLIILALEAEDPVDLIFDVADLLEGAEDLKLFFNQLQVAALHKRMRKVCSECSELIDVPQKVIQKLPACLQPENGLQTSKCAGCEHCSKTGFRGTIDIESVVEVDKNIRAALLKGGSPAEITELAYRAGTRSLLEAALEMNKSGETNLLEVFQTVKKISTPFLTAIANRKDGKPETSPHEHALQSKLDSAADDFFTADTGGSKQELPDELPPALPEVDDFKKETPSETLLLIEDDRDQLDILQLVFQSQGFTVLTAENGKQGLEVLRENNCDLVICDLMMPVMSGEQFVQEVRRDPVYQMLPILMFTAIDTQESELNLLSAGADDYCSKTTQREILILRVKRLLARSKNPLRHFLK